MSYFDANLKDYCFIPVILNRECLRGTEEEFKALTDFSLDNSIEMIEKRIKPYILTLSDLDKVFK